MKKEHATFTFAAGRRKGYQAQGKEQLTFKPQNYRGGLIPPLRNALGGLFRVIQFNISHLFPFNRFSAPRIVFQFLIAVLGIWMMVRTEFDPTSGFRGAISQAALISLPEEETEPEYISFFSKGEIPFSESDVQALISRFGKVAVAENKKFNIPASVLLSVAILESKAGKDEKVIIDNNFFGSKMGDREFPTAWANWRAHSLQLYQGAKKYQYPVRNRKEWIHFIAGEKKGHAVLYSRQLNKLISEYQLQRFDEIRDFSSI
jgi:hypothetical protein